ncbi:hypothetical protein [Marinobacter sp. C7]|uniref:hypothetical protein n=1 Tax=Marinobacter sp. C7 TaxID=2951363 RepID=UPI001EF00C70|nr:hypothetical protein [Marinobacter sp. C7]
MDFENQVALDLMQVLLGSISANVRGVSFEYEKGRVLIHYLLAEDSFEDRDEAMDMLAEFEALQTKPFDIECRVAVSSEVLPNGVGSLKGRPIYARKETKE